MRHYIHCPNCHTRMVRTGKKEQVATATDVTKVYKRQYKCPACSRLWVYDEVRNWFEESL